MKTLIYIALFAFPLFLAGCTTDTEKPIIKLKGANPQELNISDNYVELGATATDNVDGDISAKIIIDASAVDSSSEGSYLVTYNISDKAGNKANTVIRKVEVVVKDTEKPTITLVGANPQKLTINSEYVELGATASDNIDSDISAKIEIDATAVNTNQEGSYQVTYNVSDAAGNAADTVIRNVEVTTEVIEDKEKPIITLIGANPQQLTIGDSYIELGATANDNIDGNITANIVIDSAAVNTSKTGSYQVTYNVSDAAGNVADIVTRRVEVATAACINLSPSTISIGSDKNFELLLQLNTEEHKLAAFNIYIDFDPSKLAIDINKGEDTNSDTGRGFTKTSDSVDYTMMSNSNNISEGHFRLAGITATNFANKENAQIAIIHFKTKPTFNNNAEITLRINELADELGHEFNCDKKTGTTISYAR